MRVRSAVLSSLALLPLFATSGCGGRRTGCDAPTERFELDELLTADQIDEAVKDATDAASKAGVAPPNECEEVCRATYRRTRRWKPTGVESCTLTRPEQTAGPEAHGRVACSGSGVEYYCEGRRPLAHADVDADMGGDAMARSLAAMAWLEAASVLAFDELAAWLTVRGAPAELVERCRAAAEDERRHARWLTHLAEQRGVRVPMPTPRATNEASVLEVALHNAVEGCVHESFAALMAAVRAERAEEPWLRQVFASIAIDEIRHGELAWELDAWLRTRLEPTQVQRVEAAQREALARLPERARRAQACTPAALGGIDDEQAQQLASCFAARLAA